MLKASPNWKQPLKSQERLQGKSNNQIPPQAAVSQPPTESQEISEPRKRVTPDHQKFNVVMYGVKGSPPNTNRPTSDLNNITHTFSQTEVPLEQNSIKDCHRLGKFNEQANKPRPILVTFLRSGDASLLLSKISAFKGPIHIKPDLSIEERSQEAVLLKQRWSLIQRGVERKWMKIRSGALFVDKSVIWMLQGLGFLLSQL